MADWVNNGDGTETQEQIEVVVTGVDELGQQLESLDRAVQTNILKHALRSAGGVFVEPMRERAPMNTDSITDASHSDRLIPGMLKADISEHVNMGADDGPTVFIGPGKRTEYVANWIENGFNLTTHGRKRERTVIRHIPADPFVRPTFDEKVEAAIEQFIVALGDGIQVELGESPAMDSEAAA